MNEGPLPERSDTLSNKGVERARHFIQNVPGEAPDREGPTMAQMIPDSLDRSDLEPTLGERLTYQFLRNGLGDDFIVWFDRDIDGRKPDFIVWGPGIGLLVLEVKDWKPERLVEVKPDSVVIETPQGPIEHRHPLDIARRYAYKVSDLLTRKDVLLQPSGPHRGKLKFPWGCGAVMTHLGRGFCTEKGLGGLFPEPQVLFRVDLEHPIPSELLPQRLEGMFNVRFPIVGMGDPEVRALRSVLHPEVVLKQPDDQPCLALEGANDVATYDLVQERIAKSLGEGHRVLRGVAGSGKTRILISRAVRLARLNPSWQIGLFCYNLTLEAWLREAVRNQAPELAERIHAHSVTEWMKELIGEDNIDDWEADDVPDRLAESFRTGDREPPFDALMVDEGQDFRASWLRLCAASVKTPPGNLVVAADGAQSIYERGFTWKAAGIQASGGRTQVLKTNYRNTREIAAFARRFARLGVVAGFDDEVLPVDDMELSPRSGPMPQIWRFASEQDQAAFIAAEARRSFQTDSEAGTPYQDMAVLYPRARWKGVDYLSLICDKLDEQVVPYVAMAKDADWKRRSALRQVQLGVSTIHSFKGLDIDTAFLTGPLDVDDPATHRNLYYVALTRAQRRLVITYVKPNEHTGILVEAAAGRGATGTPVGRMSLVRLGLASYPLQPETVLEFSGLGDDEILGFIEGRKDAPGAARLLEQIRLVTGRYGEDDNLRRLEAEELQTRLNLTVKE